MSLVPRFFPIACAILMAAHAHADDIAICGNPYEFGSFLRNGLAAKDSQRSFPMLDDQSGISLVRTDADYDIRVNQTGQRSYSLRERGATVLGSADKDDRSIHVMVIWPSLRAEHFVFSFNEGGGGAVLWAASMPERLGTSGLSNRAACERI